MSTIETLPMSRTERRRHRRAAKLQARTAKRQAASQIIPPEGVPLELPIARMGTRFGAQIIDILITGAAAIAILILLVMSEVLGPNTISGVGVLLFFLIRVPYYVLSELAWNGQTLGKRMLKIKVISHDGGSLTTHALVLRNMMKEAEIFLPGTLLLSLNHETPIASWMSLAWVAMAIMIPLTNAHRMRLGDMLAGTHVVHLPVPSLLKDLALDAPQPMSASGNGFTFLPHQLDHYGSFELQTLESVLRAQDRRMGRSNMKRNQQTVTEIVERIRKRIGYADVIDPAETVAFLQAFYNAQRAHLEQRQLFGERRVDKFHASGEPNGDVDRADQK